jgi:peptidoglycan/xylan/chitin deacetylase (PgdA/CDA1 family)
MEKGVFIISLDFELHWGVSDHRTVESYYENLKNTPEVVQRLLTLFEQKNIRATWATVGMLFCRNKTELYEFVPAAYRPEYTNPALSNYIVAQTAGENETDDPFHYANTLIRKIIETPGQELATHTYSHYYCLEPGQTPEQFYHDILAAQKLAQREGINLLSIVFPRNQHDERYIEKCKLAGIEIYRGNFPSWMYKAEAKSTESLWKRAFRLIDTYLPVSGQRVVTAEISGGMLNIPGSCFLRPYSSKTSWLEPLRLHRIKREMTAAARKGKIYHLWWHPHNFGKNMGKNFSFLEKVINHYELLAKKYGMKSLSMKDILNNFKNKIPVK